MMTLTDNEFHSIVNFVHSKYGIDLSRKRVLIEGRLSTMLMKRGITSFQQYIDILSADKSGVEVTNLLNKLTTNHTFFLRENEHFNFLANQVLPQFEQYYGRTHTLRIWSAGCSSGQEPYTIAMALHEYFGPRRSAWTIQLLATDISMNVLSKATEGIYDDESLKDVPATWRTKYFKKLPDGRFQVNDQIRKEVDFRTLNLMDPFRFKKPFELIFCRNVMIYFDMPTKEKLVNKFYEWTSEKGYLFIGHSENINRETTKYRYIKPAIYQRREGA